MKNRLLIAMLGVGLGVLLFSANIGLQRGTSTPTAEAAAVALFVSGQQCTTATQVSVGFGWTGYNEGQQWFDLSLSNNGFAPGTFVGIGPLASGQTSFTWDGILPGYTHYMRINTLTPYGWSVSETLTFTTRDCQGSTIAVVIPNQTYQYPVNGVCGTGWYMQNGYCYNTSGFNPQDCQAGSYAFGSYCYPTGVAANDGQCASNGFQQYIPCAAPYTPGFYPQAPICYRGYNQQGQCYDTITSNVNGVQCINGYINGNVEFGLCR